MYYFWPKTFLHWLKTSWYQATYAQNSIKNRLDPNIISIDSSYKRTLCSIFWRQFLQLGHSVCIYKQNLCTNRIACLTAPCLSLKKILTKTSSPDADTKTDTKTDARMTTLALPELLFKQDKEQGSFNCHWELIQIISNMVINIQYFIEEQLPVKIQSSQTDRYVKIILLSACSFFFFFFLSNTQE